MSLGTGRVKVSPHDLGACAWDFGFPAGKRLSGEAGTDRYGDLQWLRCLTSVAQSRIQEPQSVPTTQDVSGSRRDWTGNFGSSVLATACVETLQ